MKHHLVSLFFLFPILGFSQSFILSGYVTDSTTGEALIGASVHEKNTQKGAATNRYGFFSLSIPRTNTTVKQITISYVGYQSYFIQLPSRIDTNVRINLVPASQMLKEVAVTAESEQQRSFSGIVSIPMDRIKKIPVIFGEPDLIKAISLLPGVSIGNEGTTSLLVRGGTPDQNLILLDEATVYNVSHLFGFVSVFNTDALKNVDLYKAGFPARFGGRLSSVLDITMKEGNNQERKGEWSLGLLSSRFLWEGPFSEKTKGRTSFMLSGRASYWGLYTLPFYIGFLRGEEDQYFTYWMYDLNAKLNHKFKNGGQLFASFYRGIDT